MSPGGVGSKWNSDKMTGKKILSFRQIVHVMKVRNIYFDVPSNRDISSIRVEPQNSYTLVSEKNHTDETIRVKIKESFTEEGISLTRDFSITDTIEDHEVSIPWSYEWTVSQ